MLFEPKRENKQKLIIVGVVLDNKNRILLQMRFELNNKDAHNKWELPGGKVEFGEPPQNAIEREILEETGYVVEAESIVANIVSNVWIYEQTRFHAIIIGFNCKLKKASELLENDHRVSALKWFTKNEIKELELITGVKEIIYSSKLFKHE
ncbi:MAG: DNA mismatch repair protein MutT [bacterium]|nr:MAG: DNA mismatch repair protein MutT [bacterium]